MSLATLRRELRARGSAARAEVNRRYFKTGPGEYAEGDKFIGVTLPDLRRVALANADLSLRDVAALLRSPWHEERAAALLICVRRYKRGDVREKNAIHALYLRNTRYINNWDLVDMSAEHVVGTHLPRGKRQLLVRLARSKSLWERRIAILSTFAYIKTGEFGDATRIAAILLDDEHDLIHKAVGWMVREIGNRDRAAELAFLDKYAHRMPRTALRYAIEKFPLRLRARYLAAGKRR
jgi:3-methyladenine DNA glycosylase AlkD